MARKYCFCNLFVLGLALLSSVAEETPEQISYVTSCLGSESVTLQEATSSADDVRAVFVYKGGEILGSDIIPAEKEYKDRLRISRKGEVVLYDVRLADSGVFKVEMARRDNKTSASVVLFLPEPPRIEDSRLDVRSVTSLGEQRMAERLSCGRFTSLGFPSASVLWKDPEGRLLTSTGYDDGYFHLHLSDTSPAGNYTCLLHCPSPSPSPNPCCLPPHSSLPQQARIHVDDCPSCSPPKRPPREGPSEEEITPAVTSALRKAGQEMATGMAALVNDQVQDTLETNQRQLQVWKEALEENVKKQLRDVRREFQTLQQLKLNATTAHSENMVDENANASSDISAMEKSFKTPKPHEDVNLLLPDLQPGRLENIEKNLETIHREIDEEKQELKDVQEMLTNKVTVLQKRFKSIRNNLKKHNVYKLEAMVRTLNDEMRASFQDIYQKISDWESEHQLTDEEIFANVQQSVAQVTQQLYEGRSGVDNILTNVTNKILGIQKNMTSLEERLLIHEHAVPEMSKVDSKTDSSESEVDIVLSNIELKPAPEKVTEEYRQLITRTTTVPTRRAVPTRPTTTRSPPVDRRRPGRNVLISNDTLPASCLGVQEQGQTNSGPYTLHPPGLSVQSFWCDLDSGDGGWMLIQRRNNESDHTEDFYRPWKDYVAGFGDHSNNREFWMGLGRLHTLTRERPHSLRVDLRTVEGVRGHAVYRRVRVLSARRKYRLSVQGYHGTVGDSLVVHNKPFSTWDMDNDDWSEGNCAKNYNSAWWYAGCRISDLNAPNVRGPNGIMWLYGDDTWGAGKIAFSEMKIRPL